MPLKCLSCESERLCRYTEKVKVYEQKITNNNKISKQKKLKFADYLNPDHIHCKNCGERFDYELDNNGVITKLTPC